MAWEELSPKARKRSEAVRTLGVGEEMVLNQPLFIHQAYTGGVLTPVAERDLKAYLAPFPTRDSRGPILAWARQMPLGGEPAELVARIEAYDAWLADSPDVPKLLMTFEGSPTRLIGPPLAAWCAADMAALESVHCGAAGAGRPPDGRGRATPPTAADRITGTDPVAARRYPPRGPPQARLPPAVEVVYGDLRRSETFPAIFAGIERAYVFPVCDPLPTFLDVGRAAGLQRVVSAAAAMPTNAIGRFRADNEEAVQRSGLRWTVVRPTAFMANDLAWAEAIRILRNGAGPVRASSNRAGRRTRHRRRWRSRSAGRGA